jgi:hypothetical protein
VFLEFPPRTCSWSRSPWDTMDCPEHWADGLATWRNERMANAKRHLLTPVAGSGKRMPFISIFLMLIAFSHVSLALLTTPLEKISQIQALSKRAANDSSLLECLQVAPPVLSPAGGCQQTLMVHTFAYSYGQPFIGKCETSVDTAFLRDALPRTYVFKMF